MMTFLGGHSNLSSSVFFPSFFAFVQERQRAKDMHYADPTCESKEKTHENYNANVAKCIQMVKSAGVNVMVCLTVSVVPIFLVTPWWLQIASHNVDSVKMAVQIMASHRISPAEGVFFGQLLGMSDFIAHSLGPLGYAVYKYCCFFARCECLGCLLLCGKVCSVWARARVRGLLDSAHRGLVHLWPFFFVLNCLDRKTRR
jgi:hypothetical protein